jgi:transcriptional regulator with XRE-family HTH domain
MSPVSVPAIGAYIREQREQAKISLRQLAQATGVSNPYLSQIERGLRKPSADILQQLAKGLRISAEALYVQAGFLEDRPEGSQGVRAAVLSDPELTERQKQMLLEIYDSFRNESDLDIEAAEQDQLAGPAGAELDPAALTWPELAEGHAVAMPDEPASSAAGTEQPVAERVPAPTGRKRAVAAKAAPPAHSAPRRSGSRAPGGETAAPRRAASRAPAGDRAGSKTPGSARSAEPKSGASSANGSWSGRARPSTPRSR